MGGGHYLRGRGPSCPVQGSRPVVEGPGGERGERTLGPWGSDAEPVCRKASKGVKQWGTGEKKWGQGSGCKQEALRVQGRPAWLGPRRPVPAGVHGTERMELEVPVVLELVAADGDIWGRSSPPSHAVLEAGGGPRSAGWSDSRPHTPRAGPTHRGRGCGAQCSRRPPAPPRGMVAGWPPGASAAGLPWPPGGPGGGTGAT